MSYPSFFDAVPSLKLRDPLAEFLGAAEHGVIEYRYLDAVNLAGHSCPTVAGAYWLTQRALAALYGDALPERGAIRVDFRAGESDGVTGVVARVVSLLTGAADDSGFKGIAGRFDRRRLLFFNADLPLEMRLTRTDNGARVDAMADLRRVPADPGMGELMQQSLAGTADESTARRFGALWQERVRRVLLDYANDPDVFVVRGAGRAAG